MLIIVSGLPGTGKTTFARALADRLQVVHLNSDMLRDELGKRGQYDAESKSLIYREMLERVRQYWEKGETVVVDATFYQDSHRQPYLDLTGSQPESLRWIELEAEEEIIRERVSRKRAYSEADFSVYKQIKQIYEPLRIPHLVLPSGRLSVAAMIDRAIPYLK